MADLEQLGGLPIRMDITEEEEVVATERSYGDGGGSDPSVVAKAIVRAIESERPKTRYTAGEMARPLIFARKYLGDRIFDWAMMREVS